MKGNRPQITLFGSNSGNNVGDAAILSAILDVFSRELPTAHFWVPTTNPEFVNGNYGKRYSVKALNIMPWNGALRFLGLPSLFCLMKSDVALICDGIIFGKKFFNPAFNMLITLAPLVPLAKVLGCKLVCYSNGIGPFPKGLGGRFARYLMQHCDLIMMREGESKHLAESLGVNKPIELTGDAAFLNPVSNPERAEQIARQKGIDLTRPLIGVNVTRYVDSWMNDSGKRSDAAALIDVLADGITNAISQLGGQIQPVVFSTHPMDEGIAFGLARQVNGAVITNTEFLSHDVQSIMRRCSLFMGMRFHSLVLASAVGVPVVALVYAPKVRGLMTDFGCAEYALSLSDLDATTVCATLVKAWTNRQSLLDRQSAVVARFNAGATLAAKRVKEKFFS